VKATTAKPSPSTTTSAQQKFLVAAGPSAPDDAAAVKFLLSSLTEKDFKPESPPFAAVFTLVVGGSLSAVVAVMVACKVSICS